MSELVKNLAIFAIALGTAIISIIGSGSYVVNCNSRFKRGGSLGANQINLRMDLGWRLSRLQQIYTFLWARRVSDNRRDFTSAIEPCFRTPRPALLWCVALCLLLVSLPACDSKNEQSPVKPVDTGAPVETVSLALALTPPAWLAIVAAEQGFFLQEGLTISSSYYPSGKRALKGMLRGEADIATTAGVPFVFESFSNKNIRIFAVIGMSYDDNRLVARKDSTIRTPADLRGKRIATQRASAAHFFQHLFLATHGITSADMKESFLKVENLSKALANGEVDVITTREPFLSQAKKLLGDNAVAFESMELYRKTFQLVTSDKFINDNPRTIERLVRGLIRAERFLNDQPDQAVKILSAKLALPEPKVRERLLELNLGVWLDQALLMSLEDQARWVHGNHWVQTKEIPNYLDFVYVDALKKVRTMSATIIK